MPEDSLEISIGFVGLAPGAAGADAEVLDDQIDVAVEAVGRHDRGRGTHTLPRYDKGEENGPGCGGIKGVGRGRSASFGSEPATTQIIARHCSSFSKLKLALSVSNLVSEADLRGLTW